MGNSQSDSNTKYAAYFEGYGTLIDENFMKQKFGDRWRGLQGMNLSNGLVSNDQMANLANLLKNIDQIDNLDLSNNNINDQGL